MVQIYRTQKSRVRSPSQTLVLDSCDNQLTYLFSFLLRRTRDFFIRDPMKVIRLSFSLTLHTQRRPDRRVRPIYRTTRKGRYMGVTQSSLRA